MDITQMTETDVFNEVLTALQREGLALERFEEIKLMYLASGMTVEKYVGAAVDLGDIIRVGQKYFLMPQPLQPLLPSAVKTLEPGTEVLLVQGGTHLYLNTAVLTVDRVEGTTFWTTGGTEIDSTKCIGFLYLTGIRR